MDFTEHLDYTDFAEMRAGLMRGYNPQTPQEHLLVHEAAACWRRLDQMRHRELQFFDLQQFAEAVKTGRDPEEVRKQEGSEVLMWLQTSHKAMDQIFRAIRDSGLAFDRAIKLLESMIARRKRGERQARKDEEKSIRETERRIRASHKAVKVANARNTVVEFPPAMNEGRRPDLSRAPDKI